MNALYPHLNVWLEANARANEGMLLIIGCALFTVGVLYTIRAKFPRQLPFLSLGLFAFYSLTLVLLVLQGVVW